MNKPQLARGLDDLTRRAKYSVAAFLFLCAPLNGCKRAPAASPSQPAKAARLDGTYGVRSGAVLEPVLKVERTATGYTFTERETGEWKPDPQTPHVAAEGEVGHALGLASVTGFYVYGLGTDSVLLLKLPAGWSGGQPAFTTKTGFVLVSGGTARAAEKIELGSR